MIGNDELDRLEHSVQAALRTGRAEGLGLLGAGEISLVLGLPAAHPTWACKRLPPFPSPAAANRYESAVHRYIDALTERGVEVVTTAVQQVSGPDGTTILYCIQPVLAPDAMACAIARGGGPEVRPMLEGIVDSVVATVDRRVGLDAQLSNWAVSDGRLVYFDITTPMLRDADGRPDLDSDVFVASLPWVLRPPVRRFVVPGILDRYHNVTTVLTDLTANLIKERLERWMPVLLEVANPHLGSPLTEAAVRTDYRSDARMWEILQQVRRADRLWQQRVRRRVYPYLIPERIER